MDQTKRTVLTLEEVTRVLGISKATMYQNCHKGYNPRPIPRTKGTRGKPIFFDVPTVEAHIVKNLKRWKARYDRLQHMKTHGPSLPEYIFNEMYGTDQQENHHATKK